MDMFNKARKKVKAAVKEVNTTIQQPQPSWNQQPLAPQYQQYQPQPSYLPSGQYQPPPQQYQQYASLSSPTPQQYPSPPQSQPYQQPQSPYSPPHITPQYHATSHNQPPPQQISSPPHQSSPYGQPTRAQETMYSSYLQAQSAPGVAVPISDRASPMRSPQQSLYTNSLVPANLQQPSPGANSPDPNDVHHGRYSTPHVETAPIPDLSNRMTTMHIAEPTSLIPETPRALQQSRVLSPSATAYIAEARKICPGMQGILEDYIQFYVMTEAARTETSGAIQPEVTVTICSSCFHTHIARYPGLMPWFRPLPHPPAAGEGDGQKISYGKYTCDFYMPRVLSDFYKLCVPSNSVTALVKYGNKSSSMSFCAPGATLNGQYYTNPALSDFGACETCYQYFLYSTPFEKCFIQTTNNNTAWICDIGNNGYIHRELVSNLKSPSPDFSAFISVWRMYGSLPPCPGEGQTFAVRGQDDVWVFGATQNKTGNFCQKCFYDVIQGTTLENKFNDYHKLKDEDKSELPCELSVPESTYFLEKAKRTSDDETWRRPLTLIGQMPQCPAVKGLDEMEVEQQIATCGALAEWYCFKGFPQIELCHRCYITCIEIIGASHLVTQIRRPLREGVIRQCHISPSKYPTHATSVINNFESPLHWRSQLLRNGLEYGWDSHGDWGPAIYLVGIASKWAPPCVLNTRGVTPASGRKWYGRIITPDQATDVTMVMCAECLENHIKEEDGSAFASYLDHDITEEVYSISPPDGYTCHFFGRTTQAKIREFGARNDWQGFVQHMKKRKDASERFWAWKDILDRQNILTKTHADRINAQTQMNIQMGSIRLQQQMTANINATIMGIGGSVAEAASPDMGYRYGNSNIGMGYLTSAGANAANANWNASRLPSAAENPGPVPMHLTTSIGNTGDVSEDLRYILKQFDLITTEFRAIQ